MRTRSTATAILGFALLGGLCPGQATAAEMQLRLYGSIVGFVTGPAGAAQMGAAVYLLNRYDQLIHRTFTNERGAFGFDSLVPDAYSIRVIQTSFAPASKLGVRVDPGQRSFLSIQLTSVVSSIRIMTSAPGAGSLMTDDWKWVLRSSPASRPILRFGPRIGLEETPRRAARSHIFSETRGMFALTSGEAGNAQAASIADTATAFALSTSLLGTNQLMVAGNLGYSPANGVPSAAFRTVYRRAESGAISNPEVQLTVQQVFLPMHSGERIASTPMAGVRSMSIAVSDAVRVTDRVTIEVGSALDSVSFLSRMNYLSPWAVATLDGRGWGVLQAGFSSGVPSPERTRRGERDSAERPADDLNRHIAGAALMPRVTMRDGRTRLQRSQTYELSYAKVLGSRTVKAGYFQDSISDMALTLASPDGAGLAGDVLPDFNSTSGIFNIGNLRRAGFTAQAAQRFGEWATVAVLYDRQGVLRTDQYAMTSQDPDEIRQAIRRQVQSSVSARMHGVAPRAGTRYSISYRWMDYRALTPGHAFLTNLDNPLAGLNIAVRQSLPAPAFLGSRMEISADMRNLLAQGYLPLQTPDGRRLLLIHTPRALRGGVAFFF